MFIFFIFVVTSFRFSNCVENFFLIHVCMLCNILKCACIVSTTVFYIDVDIRLSAGIGTDITGRYLFIFFPYVCGGAVGHFY